MLKLFYKFFLWITGWKTTGKLPPEIKKYIVLVVPHTSNWDFPLGICGRHLVGLSNTKVLMKKELFTNPVLGSFFKSFGGVPVDRSKTSSLVDQIAKNFEDNDDFGLIITPEGTRSYRKKWKTGFYYIAQKANIPLVLGFIDYKKKELGIGYVFYPTGDIESDLAEIKEFYKTKIPKHPEKSSLDHIIPTE